MLLIETPRVLLLETPRVLRRVRASAPDGSSPRGYVRLVESDIGSSCSEANPDVDGLYCMVQPSSVGCMACGQSGLDALGGVVLTKLRLVAEEQLMKIC